MKYSEQLKQIDWQTKRHKILERDNFECQICSKKRSAFRGLSENFGIKTLKKMLEDGHSIFKTEDSIDYERIFFSNTEGFLNHVRYIGDKNRELDIAKMLFANQYVETSTPFGTVKGYNLIGFYKENIEGQSLVDLNIHHKYYIDGNMAWEYEDDCLITLCANCHKATLSRPRLQRGCTRIAFATRLNASCSRCSAGHI